MELTEDEIIEKMPNNADIMNEVLFFYTNTNLFVLLADIL